MKSGTAKLNAPQNEMVKLIYTELDLPKEEVVWVFMELGMLMMVACSQDANMNALINQTKEGHNYLDNWEKIRDCAVKLLSQGQQSLSING